MNHSHDSNHQEMQKSPPHNIFSKIIFSTAPQVRPPPTLVCRSLDREISAQPPPANCYYCPHLSDHPGMRGTPSSLLGITWHYPRMLYVTIMPLISCIAILWLLTFWEEFWKFLGCRIILTAVVEVSTPNSMSVTCRGFDPSRTSICLICECLS